MAENEELPLHPALQRKKGGAKITEMKSLQDPEATVKGK